MAMLPDVFNVKDSEKMGEFTVLPVGWYIAEIVKSQMKDNSKKTGKYLTCQFKITDPEFAKGRYAFNLLNLINPNQQAVEIAQKELASLGDALGLDEIEDSVDMHDIPVAIKLGIDEGNGSFAPKNIIKAYKSADDIDDDELAESDKDED